MDMEIGRQLVRPAFLPWAMSGSAHSGRSMQTLRLAVMGPEADAYPSIDREIATAQADHRYGLAIHLDCCVPTFVA